MVTGRRRLEYSRTAVLRIGTMLDRIMAESDLLGQVGLQAVSARLRSQVLDARADLDVLRRITEDDGRDLDLVRRHEELTVAHLNHQDALREIWRDQVVEVSDENYPAVHQLMDMIYVGAQSSIGGGADSTGHQCYVIPRAKWGDRLDVVETAMDGVPSGEMMEMLDMRPDDASRIISEGEEGEGLRWARELCEDVLEGFPRQGS